MIDGRIPTPEVAASESKVNNADPKAVAVKQQDIDKDEIGIDKNMNGVFPISSEKTFKNMSKSRTTLFQGREDDEPMAQQNNSFGNFSDENKDSIILSSNNLNASSFIKIGAFSLDVTQMIKDGIIDSMVTLPNKLIFQGDKFLKKIKATKQISTQSSPVPSREMMKLNVKQGG